MYDNMIPFQKNSLFRRSYFLYKKHVNLNYNYTTNYKTLTWEENKPDQILISANTKKGLKIYLETVNKVQSNKEVARTYVV